MFLKTEKTEAESHESGEEDVLYSNFTYHPDTYYFLYVGDLKNYSLNFFVRETLMRRLGRQDVQFIAIVPDICIQYNYSNLIVIHPLANEHMIKQYKANGTVNGAPRSCCRLDAPSFMTAVSKSGYIHRLIQTILEHQNQLYVNMYESVVEMNLDSIDRVSVLGPDKCIAKQYNNKIVQRQKLAGIVPLIDGYCCETREEMLERTKNAWGEWSDGVFVSAAYSAGGANSAVTSSQQEVEQRFVEEDRYVVTKYIPHDQDPTVLAVVANENEVYVAGIADQNILGGNRFVGSTFPSIASAEHQEQLRKYTVLVGRELGKAGYRGIFGCDFLIDRNGQIFFLEINARKQGTTLEFCYTMEQTLPEGAPMLPELEYFAVTENQFPQTALEMTENHRNIHWGTYNYKVRDAKLTTGYIPQNPYERETFRKIARKELLKDFVILEHLGTHFLVQPGVFLARVVSVARNPEDVQEGLVQGVKFIEQTVKEADVI